MMVRRGKFAVVAGGAAVLVALAGCGSSGKNSSGGKGASGKAINIGLIASLSGGANTLPEVPVGAAAAVKAINKAGGIGGHLIHIVQCDDATNPNTGTACGNQLVAAHVAAAVVNGSEGDSYMPPLKAANIPVLTGFPNSTDEQTFPNVFPISAGSIAGVASSAAMCAKLGAKTISLPVIDLPSAFALIPGADAVIGPFGLSAADTKVIKVPPTATDLSSYVSIATKSDCVAQVLSPNQQALFAQQAVNSGSKVPVIFSGGAVPAVRIASLKSATNLYEGFVLPDSTFASVPGVQTFINEVKAYGAHGQPLDSGMLAAWAAMHLAAKYIDAGNPTGSATMQALMNAGTINMPPLPPLNFANNVSFLKSKGVRAFTNGVIFTHFVNGKFVPYYNGQYQDVNQLKSAPPLGG